MLPPGIPREVADSAMILMSIIAVMGKNQIRIYIPLYFFKEFFNLRPIIGKEAITEVPDYYLLSLRIFKKERCAGPGFPLAFAARAEDYPNNVQISVARKQLQNRAPAANLNII